MKVAKLKSESGFTMTDLVVALIIFSMLAGLVGTFLYSSYKSQLETKLAGDASYYAIKILEDIDKMSYDDVTNGMESNYKSKFSIPSGYNLTLEVTNYNEGTNKLDLIKNVKLTIKYGLDNETKSIVINKIKAKEV